MYIINLYILYMQTVEYKSYQDVFVLYRGGIRYSKDIKKGENEGYDPYDRCRVRPKEELSQYSSSPKDKGICGFEMSQAILLFPWFSVHCDDGKKRIAKFLGLSENYKNKGDAKVNMKLNVCFTADGRLVLFKDGCKPVRKHSVYKTFTKKVEEWGGGHKQWGVRNPKYEIDYWDFKNDTDYIIVSLDDRVLWGVLPLMYEQKFCKMISAIHLAAYESYEKATELKKQYCDELWNVEPFSLDESWDYTDEQKQYIKEFEEEYNRRRLKEMYDLEQRKTLPGYCDDCGCEGATYRLDPYAEEMWDKENYCWLCDECAHQRAMEV